MLYGRMCIISMCIKSMQFVWMFFFTRRSAVNIDTDTDTAAANMYYLHMY
jgi:hypothetical protein